MEILQQIRQAATEKVLTDLRLTLVDIHNDTIEMNVHKIFLYAGCEYFRKMFGSNFVERNMTELTVNDVPEVNVASDIIDSFYGKEIDHGSSDNWYHQLQYIRCCYFFGMQMKIDLRTLVVPADGFENLLDIVLNIIGINENTIKLLAHNLPIDFDMEKIPTLVLKLIYHVCNKKVMLSFYKKKLRFWEIDYPNFIQKPYDNKSYLPFEQELISACISSDSQKIATICVNNICIDIWNSETFELLKPSKVIPFYIKFDYIRFIDNDQKILLASQGNNIIVVYDISENKFDKIIIEDVVFSNFSFCGKTSQIAYECGKDMVTHNLDGSTIVRTNRVKVNNADGEYIIYFCHSQSGNLIMTQQTHSVNIYNAHTLEKLKTINYKNPLDKIMERYVRCCFISDYKIAVVFNKTDIKIYGEDNDDNIDPISYWQNMNGEINCQVLETMDEIVNNIKFCDHLVTIGTTVKIWSEKYDNSITLTNSDEKYFYGLTVQPYNDKKRELLEKYLPKN